MILVISDRDDFTAKLVLTELLQIIKMHVK